MTLWIIEPQDPLIVRDGRPFHATPGARARSLPFPFPSTTAGGVRTRAGQNGEGMFDTSEKNIDAVKEIVVRGPLLVEMQDGGEWHFLVPAPADALVLDDKEDEGKVRPHWLRPLTFSDGIDSNKPDELKHLIGLPNPRNEKPAQNAPKFWHWRQFAAWLTDPASASMPLKPAELGQDGPQPDRRVHVGIDPANFSGKDGDLFLTSGRTFWNQEKNDAEKSSEHKLSQMKRLALAVAVENLGDLSISSGFAPLGGERRLMNWQQPKNKTLPTLPKELAETIIANGGYCRLILLTPTYFESGWQPSHFGNTPGTTVTLQAAAVSNPVVVSGWDFVLRKPKPTRRLAPAGSVYFVKVEGDVRQWVTDRWLRALSDDDELAKAGFGLTVVGNWDGTTPALQINLKEESHG